MITLTKQVEEIKIDIAGGFEKDGFTLFCKPQTRELLASANARAVNRLNEEFAVEDNAKQTPPTDQEKMERAILLDNYQTEEVAVLSINSWEGVGDEDNNPLPATEDNIRLFMNVPDLAQLYKNEYFSRAKGFEQVKKTVKDSENS